MQVAWRGVTQAGRNDAKERRGGEAPDQRRALGLARGA